jgi:hypothetical protein
MWIGGKAMRSQKTTDASGKPLTSAINAIAFRLRETGGRGCWPSRKITTSGKMTLKITISMRTSVGVSESSICSLPTRNQAAVGILLLLMGFSAV